MTEKTWYIAKLLSISRELRKIYNNGAYKEYFRQIDKKGIYLSYEKDYKE